jgi:hypothetical protein
MGGQPLTVPGSRTAQGKEAYHCRRREHIEDRPHSNHSGSGGGCDEPPRQCQQSDPHNQHRHGQRHPLGKGAALPG